jgi:hypothetical protein
MQKFLLKLDIQTFSEGEGEFGAYDPQSAYEGISGSEEPPATADLQMPEGELPQNPELTQPPSAEPEFLDFGGRKIPAVNDDLQGLHKDFTEQQRYITTLQDQIQAYKQLAELSSQQVQAQPQTPVNEPPSANVAEWDEGTWETFYEKPNDVLGPIIQSQVQQALESIQPIIQEREWQNEVQQMHDRFSDFGDYTDNIQKVLEQNPELADRPGGLEDAYYRAKAQAASPAPTMDQLLNDPGFVQNLLQNQQIQNQFLNQYMQNRQAINQQTPPVMGRQGGFTPQTPESSPTTLREASRQFMKTQGYR